MNAGLIRNCHLNLSPKATEKPNLQTEKEEQALRTSGSPQKYQSICFKEEC